MLTRLLRRCGPLLALALVAAAAIASLFGVAAAQRVAGSPLFIAGSVLVGISSLAAAVVAARGRRWASLLVHCGLVAALAGVFVNQRLARPGYVFLELGGPPGTSYISADLRRLEILPAAVRLESLATLRARGFLPATVAWTRAGSARPVGVTWNRPLALGGRQLLFSRAIEPGFLEEYELTVDSADYVLLHNQIVTPAPGTSVQSIGYDPDDGRVGIRVNRADVWLAAGGMAQVDGHLLRVRGATFARAMGVIYGVNDIRFRSPIFAGLGLTLLGLLGPLFRRRKQ